MIAAIVAIALGTFLLRWSFIARPAQLPARLQAVLPFIPAAVLAALVVPMITSPQGPPEFNPERLSSALTTALVAYKTRNAGLAIAAGLLVFWGLSGAL